MGSAAAQSGVLCPRRKQNEGIEERGGRVGETVRLLYYNKAAKRGENMAPKSFCAVLVNSPFLGKSWQNVGKTWVWTHTVDRLLSARLDCCIITKAERPGQDRWSGQEVGGGSTLLLLLLCQVHLSATPPSEHSPPAFSSPTPLTPPRCPTRTRELTLKRSVRRPVLLSMRSNV